jgi:ParB/RepB/Spo0J family partition protein
VSAAIAEVPKAKALPGQGMAEVLGLQPGQLVVQEILVDLIVRSETNRQPELDDDFVESIRAGVDSPVLLRPIKATIVHVTHQPVTMTPFGVGDTIYKLVYGERRWAASKKAGKKTIPAIVRELTDTRALEIQIRENEQRKNYNALDRAAAYTHLRAQYMLDHKNEKGFTEEKCCSLIAEACKNDKIKGRTVQQIIALEGKLSPECKEALRKGEMEQSHAYEFSRLAVADQAELLLWLRQQTHHSQGDIPSVRRLKLEIHKMDELREEEKRRQPLFQEDKAGSGAGAKLTFDGKTIELTPGPLPGSVRTALLKTYPDLSTTAHFLKDGRIQLARGLTGKPFCLTVPELQNVLATGIPFATKSILPEYKAAKTAAQTSAATSFPHSNPLPPAPTRAATNYLKAEKEQREKDARQRSDALLKSRIGEQYRAAFFGALASKARICSRLLTQIIPGRLLELWVDDPLCVEKLAPVLGWPEPKGGGYSQPEVEAHAQKYTRKFSGNLLAALIIMDHRVITGDDERLAKYFGIDSKKLHKQATAAVKQEDAKLKANGQKPKAGVRA